MGVRAFHLYISVVPTAVMAVLGLAAAMDLTKAGTSSAMGRLALVVIAGGAVIVLGAAVFGADTATRREHQGFGHPAAGVEDLQRRLAELGFLISHGRQDLQSLTERVMAGETPPPRGDDSLPVPTGDPLVYLAREIQMAQNEAWNAVIKAGSTAGGAPAQRVEVFVNLARRMQSLSHRAIQGLDELENQVEDPDLLKGLFRVDHLSTRMRRQAESLAVIGGAASRRQWSSPVTMYEVLRSAIAEVEHYNRVKVVPPVEGTLDGAAVADVIHLLAELVENATKFAPPNTQVLLRAEPVTAGVAIEIEDRGLGIPRESQRRLNDLLADIDRIDTEELLQDGRIGLLVVSALSRRHNVAVRLQTNLYGGTQAVVVIPNELIGSEKQETNTRLETPSEPEAVSASTPETTASMSYSGSGQGTARTPVLSDQHAAGAGLSQPSGAGLGEPSAGAAPWSDPNAGAPVRQAQERTDRDPPRNEGMRPQLPRRHAQASLVPELLDTPTAREDDAEPRHNPGLMAAFQKGMRSGQEDDLTDEFGGTD